MSAFRPVVTSSGFCFERRGEIVSLNECPPRIVPLAELEYLREIEPGAGGRITKLARASAGGRTLHVVTVEMPGAAAPRVITFDVGAGWLGTLRTVQMALGYVIYGLAASTLVGTLIYLVTRLWD